MKTLTISEWQHATGATGEPDDAHGDPLSVDDVITVSDDGESYCVGVPDGNEAWMRFDGKTI